MGTQILRDGGSCHIHPLVSSAITVSFVLPLFPARFPFPSPSPLFSLSLSLNGFLPASDEYKEPQIHHYYCKLFGYKDRSLNVTHVFPQRCHIILFSLHFGVQEAPKHRLTQHKLGSVANGRRTRTTNGSEERRERGEGMKEEGGTEFCSPKDDDSHAARERTS